MQANRTARVMVLVANIGVVSLQAATADILLDHSPEATNAPASGDLPLYGNDKFYHFADRARFSWPSVLTGIDIYSYDFGSIGDPRVIHIRKGNKGFPSTLVVEKNEPIALIDIDGAGGLAEINRKHVELNPPIILDPLQDYWVGMYAEGALANGALGLASNPPDDGRMALFTSFGGGGEQAFGDLAFRLHGNVIDTDSDGVADNLDNCQSVANAAQRDTDSDGIGNYCDADLTNDCVVNFPDLEQMRQVFFTADETADFDGNGVVNFADLEIMRNSFFGKPGPSAVANACDTAPSASLVWFPGPVSGSIPVFASLDDDYGIVLALLRVDGIVFDRLTTAPWQFQWDTVEVLDGTHAVTVDAVDTAGHITTSAPEMVVVENGNQLLLDYSPATTGGLGPTSFGNFADAQNFGELVVFETDVTLTQVDIYCDGGGARVGYPVTIRVWADNAGEPGELLYELLETISEMDVVGVGTVEGITRKEARLSEPLDLPAGTYWMGMSLTDDTYPFWLAQMALDTNSPGDGRMAQFSGTDFFVWANGDMAIRVIGAPAE